MNDETIVKAVKETNSFAEAAASIGMNYSTFARRASKLGLKGNPALKGAKKPWTDARKNKVELDEILANRKWMPSCKVKDKLFSAGLKENRCESCGISEWNGKPIACHLDHVNGDNRDNRLENLKVLCPNCHSQTPTYCRGQGKNTARVAKLVDAPRLGRDVLTDVGVRVPFLAPLDDHWITLVYPLAPSEANRDMYKSLIIGNSVLLLGCTQILLPLATEAVDLVQRYPDPKIRVGDWHEVEGHYDTVLADGCICMGKEQGMALLKYYSTRCDRLIARCFSQKHPTMRIADHFPIASDFEIPPKVHHEAEWYRFYVWDFV